MSILNQLSGARGKMLSSALQTRSDNTFARIIHFLLGILELPFRFVAALLVKLNGSKVTEDGVTHAKTFGPNLFYFAQRKIIGYINNLSERCGSDYFLSEIKAANQDELFAKSAHWDSSKTLFMALINSDMDKARETRWPKAKYADYHLNAPADVAPDILIDGRMPDGSEPSAELGAKFISRDLVHDANRKATVAAEHVIRNGVFAIDLFFKVAVISVIAYLSYRFYSDIKASQNVYAYDFMVGKAAATLSATYIYSLAVAKTIGAAIISALGIFAICLLASVGVSSYAKALWWRASRMFIMKVSDYKADLFRRASKEAMVTFKKRMEDRRLHRQNVMQQVQAVSEGGWDSKPGVQLGKSTGTFKFRGALAGVNRGVPMVLSPMATALHTLVFGVSGTGKTSRVLRPLYERDVKNIMENGAVGSLYGTDGKAVLYKSLAPVAEQYGLETIIIGTEPGMVGVDMLQGVSPNMVANILQSVLEQAGGDSGGGDDFWPERAGYMMRISGTLLEAWEYTEAGRQYAKERGTRPYSLINIYRLASESPAIGSFGYRIIQDILNDQSFNDPANFNHVQHIATEGLKAAMDYFFSAWWDAAESNSQTLVGIQANVSKALSSFEAMEPIRQRFASGENSEFQIKDIWEKPRAVFTSINTLEYGLAGKVVLIFLKTLVFMEARKREMLDPKSGDKHFLKFYADEVQDLVTKSANGISDTNFINVARSAMGPAGGFVCATQTFAALEQAIGEVSARNYTDQFSNLICFRVRDKATIEMMKQMAGKSMRFDGYESEDYESFEAMKEETGTDPLSMGPATGMNNDYRVVVRLANVAAMEWDDNLNYAGYKSKYMTENFLDYVPPSQTYSSSAQGVGPGSLTTSDNTNAVLGAFQTAEFRAQDKNLEYMSRGNTMEDVLHDNDFSLLGNTKAITFWIRGGVQRMDIVDYDEAKY